ncbi:MAG: signal peptide peptidase SppA, 67K type [Idiomarinaceae bacterium HL-53]|nr:MAG: signal peptide peptidase SppA, 67K type [Idiomarinaceae bacterium HL-53]CUS48954.1 protease-4 [Idiomarinaceae bacterium HL-53]
MLRFKQVFLRILKYLNAIRIGFLNVIFVLIVLLFAGIWFFQPDDLSIERDSVLVLNPQGYLVEQQTVVPLIEQLRGDPFGSSDAAEVSVYSVLAAIDHAIYDDRILGIVLDLRYFWGGGLSKLQQVGAKLAKYREETGRPVYAFGDYYSQSQYYLAAHASHVILDEAGSVDIRGFYAYQTYISDLLEKFKIDAHIFRAGEFKSASEPYQRSEMSSEARVATESWLNALWQSYLADIRAHRIIDPRALSGVWVDHLMLREENAYSDSSYALQSGLADELMSRIEFNERLESDLSETDNPLARIHFNDYLQVRERELGTSTHEHPIVEVITLSGAIYYGAGSQTSVGSDTIIQALEQALENDNVKAVLLRIDSPGGSAFASELIRKQVVRLREAGKPVVVSMSSVAASGGYWVALGAETIFAKETTLTGSIGVFGMVFTVPEALADIGVYSDGVATSELPIIDSFRSLPDSAKHILQLDVERTYEQFLNLVVTHRGLTYEEALAGANGRVWTGKQALELGLVDQIGDISAATQHAAELAGLENYVVRRAEPELSALQQWVQRFMNQTAIDSSPLAPQQALAPLSWQRIKTEIETLSVYNDPNYVYARCLSCMEY